MELVLIITGYLRWHYGRAFADILVVWTNFFWFVLHFFSIPLLARTLFSPWKRLHEEYQLGFHPGVFFSSLIVNFIMRIVGAAARFIIIVMGMLILTMVTVVGVVFLLFWTVAPAGVFISMLAGFMLLS